ncbi:hypothetical protein ABPG75_011705 [Micractinium tetrahymenae]
MLFGLLGARPPWQWRLGPSTSPSPDQLAAACAALRRQGRKAAAERAAVVAHLAAAGAPTAPGSATALQQMACSADLLDALADALHPGVEPSQETIQNTASLVMHLAPGGAAAVGGSGIVQALAALLRQPSSSVPPDAKLKILECFKYTARFHGVRHAMEAQGVPAAVVAALRSAVAAGDWPLAGEAAWALELMAGMSRRLTTAIGEAGGVEAVLSLLEEARLQQPALRELPRDELSAEAAGTALHALLVLLTDNRRNRGRLQRAGGASELAAAFQDERLEWEAREQAVGLLQDLAAALALDGASAEQAGPGGGAAATPGTASLQGGGGGTSGAPPAQHAQQEEWRGTLLPALVAVLHQRRGQQMLECKEAVAGVLAKYAGNGPQFVAAVSEAGALAPLVQLLFQGLQAAGGERRTAIAALQALEPLVSEAECQKQLVGPCVSASGQLDLLGLLRRLLSEATAPELGLASFAATGGGSGPASDGRQLVAAGWHAALLTARLCSGAVGGSVQVAQQLQDAAVARGFLPLLAPFLKAEVPAAAAGAAALGGAAGALPCTGDGQAAELMTSIQCEVAALLRSISMRRTHHAALRSAEGLLPRLRALLAPGAPGWVDLKAAAKKILQHLGDLADTDRPLLTYTPQQLAALLEEQGIEASRFRERGVTGAEFVRLTDADLRGLAAAGQQGRVLRVLRAYETFSEIDSCGPRTGSLGLAKLADWLNNRGFRAAEVVPLAESLMGLLDGDRDDAASFPDFLQAYDEFLARTMADLQPPSKRRRTESRLA